MADVRVRFAPSPTGFLHIGGARTALFNWLFARSLSGKFFLRIEDTDQSRSTDEAILAICDGLSWLGLTWDEWESSQPSPQRPTEAVHPQWPVPLRQTGRFDLYRNKVSYLLNHGMAYRCYCTAEELDTRRKEALAQGRPPRYDGRCRNLSHPILGITPAIRFAAPSEGDIVIDDMVKGKVTFEASVMDDMIILRSDGTPTYNLCVVVDDVDMNITHVLRGDDHLNNTPRQIGLYRAFGYPVPKFGHFSMILGSDKTRLSKRHGATAVQQYREEGYLPEAMVNYLVRLGWSYKDQEIFSVQELVEKFSMNQVGASPAIFNPDKLLWLNAHYIKTGDPGRMASLLSPHLEQQGIKTDGIDQDRLKKIIVALQERSRTLREMAESAAYFFTDTISLDDSALQQLTAEALPILIAARQRLEGLSFTHDTLQEGLKSLAVEMGLKLAKVAQSIRAAVTGKTVSPGIFDVLEILGKEATLIRLDRQIKRLEQVNPIA